MFFGLVSDLGWWVGVWIGVFVCWGSGGGVG